MCSTIYIYIYDICINGQLRCPTNRKYIHLHSGSIFQLCLFKWMCWTLITPTHPPQQPPHLYRWSNIQFRFRVQNPPEGTSRSKTPRRYGAKGLDLNRVQGEGMRWRDLRTVTVWWKHTTSKFSRKFRRFVFLHRKSVFLGILVEKDTHNFPLPGRFAECSFGSDDCPFQFGMIFQLPAVGSFRTPTIDASRSRSHQDVAFKGGAEG